MRVSASACACVSPYLAGGVRGERARAAAPVAQAPEVPQRGSEPLGAGLGAAERRGHHLREGVPGVRVGGRRDDGLWVCVRAGAPLGGLGGAAPDHVVQGHVGQRGHRQKGRVRVGHQEAAAVAMGTGGGARKQG